MPEVEVTRRPTRERQRITYIPDEVREHFRSLGLNFGFRSTNETMQAQDASVGWQPVRWDELPERLRRYFHERQGGVVGRGDMVLCTRSYDDREAQLEEERLQRESFESVEAFAEELNDTMRSITGSRSEGLAAVSGGDVRNYVRGGDAAARSGVLAEDVLKAVEEAKQRNRKE